MSDSTSSDKQLNLGAACFRCRGFRHACDRRKPSCSRCHRRGINCVYPEAAPTLKNLQSATEALDHRIKKLHTKLNTRDINSQRSSSIISTYSEEDTFIEETQCNKVASTSQFSVYPCTKCFKDLQQCDLTLPKCSRCEGNNFDCTFKKNEPKANHVSQVLNTMNKVMDQWQVSMDHVANEFTQRTRQLSFIIPVTPITAWRISCTPKKQLSLETNVNSYHDFSNLIHGLKKILTPSSTTTTTTTTTMEKNNNVPCFIDEPMIEFDDSNSIHSTSGFAIWNQWSHPTHALPQDYPIDISQELTDNLVELYCRTPCCSSIRLPIIDTVEFLSRYRDPDPKNRPSKVLIYAICAMSARNAFQLHVWSKRPSFGAPQYNMGKALSVAYCLRGREELSDCFDHPTFDNCQAAFLLSYCNYQNGYAGVIYFYEWIAYTMALQLGLYEESKELTRYESMLIWCIYYCNAWYKVLQGGGGGNINGLSECKPKSPLPKLIDKPPQALFEQQKEGNEANEKWIDYYVWNTWVYLIQLQILRDQSMARLVSYQLGLDVHLAQDLFVMQEKLKEFYNSLPNEWQSSNLDNNNKYCSSESSHSTSIELNETYQVDLNCFSRYCVNFVSLHYSINEIILYQGCVPMNKVPSTRISIECLETCLKAANNICQIAEDMIQDCHVPLVGILFASIIYRKFLSYSNEDYYEIGKFGLLRSIDISKNSINYKYDFEMACTLVRVMERDIQSVILQRSYVMESSTDSSPSPSIPSPTTNYNSFKEW